MKVSLSLQNQIYKKKRGFKLNRQYKNNTCVQIIGVWASNDIIVSETADEWEFNKPYFTIDGEYDSNVKEIFNSLTKISNAN